MIESTHDKTRFFKYYSPESAKATLKYTTLKWSSPLEFNDPFDNQFDLDIEKPDLTSARELSEDFFNRLSSPEPIQLNEFGPNTYMLEFIRLAHVQNPHLFTSNEYKEELVNAMFEGMDNVFDKKETYNQEIRDVMADISIFCVSETNDNILMWSHYANNHNGAVVEFLPLKEVDSPLMLAKPVIYTEHMPKFDFRKLMNFDTLKKEVMDILTLTKATQWSYEQEWRVVTTMRDKSKTHEILPYAPDEIGGVYLGCKMKDDDKEELIDITRKLYPSAKIYQAYRHPREFKLTFELL